MKHLWIVAAITCLVVACDGQPPTLDVEIETMEATADAPRHHRATAPAATDAPRWAVESALSHDASRFCGEATVTPLEGSSFLEPDVPVEPVLLFRCNAEEAPGRIQRRVGAPPPELPPLAAGHQRKAAWATGNGRPEREVYQLLLGGMVRDLYLETCNGKGVQIHRITTTSGHVGTPAALRVDVFIDYTCAP